MRSSILLLAFSVTGCLEGEVALFGCPPDEVCSDDTPVGLHFFGAAISNALQLGNNATAVGGTQNVALMRKVGAEAFVPLTAGYIATGGTAVAVESKDANVVTLRGQSVGENNLEIRDIDDDSLMDRKLFDSAEIVAVSVGPAGLESRRLPSAFLPGTIRFGIGLSGPDGAGRLVDESMTIDLVGSTQLTWDLVEFPDAQVGAIPVTVTAGDKPPVTLDVTVVAQIDELVDEVSDGLIAGQTGFACFHAVAGGTHDVANLDWEITGDTGTVGSFLSANCVAILVETPGEITITATAGGLTKVVTYPVAEMMAKPTRATTVRSTAGERATAEVSRSR
ncbi:MAG: hypothetical protein H0V17_35980 [Deltaproteobacteria bacterium]|nr:hypothetical protein [Deltaproteobacteria bacterium]